MTRRRRWDQQRVVGTIRTRHKQGFPLTGVWRDWPALYRAAQTHCGSWHKAVLAAGLECRTFRRWSRERVLKEIHTWYRDNQKRDDGLMSTAVRFFGSWKQAVLAAGLEPCRRRKWTKQRVVDAIQDRHVRGLPVYRVERSSRSLVTAGRSYFGSWKQALEAAGLANQYQDTRPPRNWSRKVVIDEIQAFHRQGQPITKVWQRDPTLYSAAKHQFGSWRAAVVAAGFQPSRRSWSKQVILAEIRDRDRQGVSLRSTVPANINLVAAAIRYFGTWQEALQAAGVQPT